MRLLIVLFLLVCCGSWGAYANLSGGPYLALDFGFMATSPYEVNVDVDVYDLYGDPFGGLSRSYHMGDSVGYVFSGAIGTTVSEYFAVEGELGYRAIESTEETVRSYAENDFFTMMLNIYCRSGMGFGISAYAGLGVGLAFLASEGEYVNKLWVDGDYVNSRVLYQNALMTSLGGQAKIGIAYKLGAFGDTGVTLTALVATPLEMVHDVASWAVVYDDVPHVLDVLYIPSNPASLSGFRVSNYSLTWTTRLFFAS